MKINQKKFLNFVGIRVGLVNVFGMSIEIGNKNNENKKMQRISQKWAWQFVEWRNSLLYTYHFFLNNYTFRAKLSYL